jgi:hypothetical protein
MDNENDFHVRGDSLPRGSWIGWSATRMGYTVTVYDDESHEVYRYDAGNSPFDSVAYVSLESKAQRLPLQMLRRYAKQTAEAMAAEYGVNQIMIHEEESGD